MPRTQAPNPLDRYHAKRDFTATAEPRGRAKPTARKKSVLSYVIQRHHARRLHYDFRLEWNGVLVSWAIPKGPSLDPKEKRLAVHVEDHPLEYGSFEGHIPEGHYGAGSVAIWDSGSWTPLEDVDKGLQKGHLKFRLEGQRLAGDWLLIRTGRDAKDWLLRKLDDQFVQAGHDAEAEMKSGPARWQPLAAPKPAKKSAAHARKGNSGMPDVVPLQLATLVDRAPPGEGWIFEIKYDGYRMSARIEQGKVSLFSRNDNDWTSRLPQLAADLERLGLPDCWLDGEIVVNASNGVSDFQALQAALGDDTTRIRFMIFDVLFWQGEDLREQPLMARLDALDLLFKKVPKRALIARSEPVSREGALALQEACRLGLEGLIGKRLDAPYLAGRSTAWIKLKCRPRHEVVIGGFTDPAGARSDLGALLVGFPTEDGKLKYAGRVGTGFDAASLARMRKKLDALEIKQSPFTSRPREAGKEHVHWVKPELVAEVAVTSMTREGILRQASFVGLREDKTRTTVTEEVAMKVEDIDAPVQGVRISNPDRVVFKDAGLRKIDVARYYEAVGEHIIDHLKSRPLSLVRCPQGADAKCFFQKHVGQAPEGTIEVSASNVGSDGEFVVVQSTKGLVGLVQMGVIELHTWGAREPRLDRPDRIILDLDPEEGMGWKDVLEGAQLTRALIEQLGLPAFVKTTGGKGLHVVIPLKPTRGWGEVKGFARALAIHLASVLPDRFTANLAKAKRHGKIFVDYLRNGREATAVSAFSVRARAGAPVSVPIAWDELELSNDIREAYFNIRNVPRYLAARKADPWADYDKRRATLTVKLLKTMGVETGGES